MGTIYIDVTSTSGINYAATIERMSDGYFRQDDAEVFNSGLVFADKDITLTEGTNPNICSYTGTVVATTWNDGVYKLRVHNKDDLNKVEGSQLFGVVAGNEVNLGESVPIYHADIQFIKDSANVQDEYRIRWFKNGIRVTSGVTNPALSVINPSGVKLVNSKVMHQVGDAGYRYYATTVAERQTSGETYEVVTSGTIDSATRSYSWILGRDSS